ncbi:MAG: kelch repeat-containing protein [Steroidobacteraceae bacterium]
MRSVTWMKIIGSCAALVCFGLADAQTFFPRLTPVPPRGPRIAAAAAPAISASSSTASPWQPLNNQPPFTSNSCNGGFPGAANPLLLTDGTVIVQDAGCQDWWRLTPDNTGSYANGTWTQIASLPSGYAPLYHSSAVLPDGRVIIMGGEYNFFNPIWTAQGAIYDPLTDAWKSVAPPPSFSVIEVLAGPPPVYGQTIGDAQSIVLANGTYMQADCCTFQSALLDPKTLTWTPTGAGKYDPNDEEGWNLLPDGEVLTVDAYVPIAGFPYLPTGTNSELYNPATGRWHSAGSTIVQLWDSGLTCGELSAAPPTPTFELGPGVLRADGTVLYAGSNTCPTESGNTAIYDAYSSVWRPGPVFPEVDGVKDLNIADGPASWEPNDKVLMMASPEYGNPPSFFFEWDGRRLKQVPGPPNAPVDGSYYGNMLVLPSGQILFTDFSGDIELYNPTIAPEDREFQRRIAPVIVNAPQVLSRGGSYEIYGVGFNGVTQGASYGDDVQAATNFPLVRITNLKTSHVFYSRTHDHSSMAVASDRVVSTHFDVPAAQERGPSLLQVVANGVASSPVFVFVY